MRSCDHSKDLALQPNGIAMLVGRFEGFATGLSDRMAEWLKIQRDDSQRKQECSYSVWKKCSGSVDLDIAILSSSQPQ